MIPWPRWQCYSATGHWFGAWPNTSLGRLHSRSVFEHSKSNRLMFAVKTSTKQGWTVLLFMSMYPLHKFVPLPFGTYMIYIEDDKKK